MVEQARKAMFSVLMKSRKLQLSIDLQLQLFDSMIVPILLYGSEVTGFENSDILERLCTQFYKNILNVKESTPNCILYGELGRYPIREWQIFFSFFFFLGGGGVLKGMTELVNSVS